MQLCGQNVELLNVKLTVNLVSMVNTRHRISQYPTFLKPVQIIPVEANQMTVPKQVFRASQQSGIGGWNLRSFVFSHLTLRNEGGTLLRNVGRNSAGGTLRSPSPSRHKIVCCAVCHNPKSCEGCEPEVGCHTRLPEHCVLPLNL